MTDTATNYPGNSTAKSLREALKGHSRNTMSQDSGNHCHCGSDSRFVQTRTDGFKDLPWSDIDEHRAHVVLLWLGTQTIEEWGAWSDRDKEVKRLGLSEDEAQAVLDEVVGPDHPWGLARELVHRKRSMFEDKVTVWVPAFEELP